MDEGAQKLGVQGVLRSCCYRKDAGQESTMRPNPRYLTNGSRFE